MYGERLALYRRAFASTPPRGSGRGPPSPAAIGRAAQGWIGAPGCCGRVAARLVAGLGPLAAGLFAQRLGVLDPLQDIAPFAFLGGALLVTVALGWLGLRRGIPSKAAYRARPARAL